MYWFVLFVKTGYEHDVVSEISTGWEIYDSTPYVPMYEANFRRGGRVYPEKRLLFPGYVFIKSKYSGTEFYSVTRPYIIHSENVLKLLRYGDSVNELEIGVSIGESYEMRCEEYLAFMELHNEEGCIEMSKGLIEGDQIHIVEGPLKGFESRVKKIRASKMEANIELDMMGRTCELKVGLEIMKKHPHFQRV